MLISVHVKPGSKQGPKLEKITATSYIAHLRERAHDGEANAALLKLLSKEFDIPKTSITIKSGRTSRHKILEF